MQHHVNPRFSSCTPLNTLYKISLATWGADRSMICSINHMKALREIIQRLRDLISLKLRSPLPHLNK